MKKSIIFSITIGIFLMANGVLATTGGPTYISSIAFNKADNSVYYTVHDNGGRGCPPIVNKINISTLARSEIKSCDQLESGDPYSEEGMKIYSQFIHDTYQGLPYLWSVSLKKNNIDVEVKLLSEQSEEDFIYWSEFQATLTQDGKELGKINFRGCAKDQPHVFEGYMIPGTNAMAMLISNKGDCFEYGYIKETLHVIKGINYYNKDVVRSFKEESATEPNSGNMVVYASSDEVLQPPTEVNITNSRENTKLYLILTLILGFGIGYFLGHKKGKTPNQMGGLT